MKFEIPDCNALSTLDRITWFETGSSKILFAAIRVSSREGLDLLELQIL